MAIGLFSLCLMGTRKQLINTDQRPVNCSQFYMYITIEAKLNTNVDLGGCINAKSIDILIFIDQIVTVHTKIYIMYIQVGWRKKMLHYPTHWMTIYEQYWMILMERIDIMI